MLTTTPDGRTAATVTTHTRHRFGSLTPRGEARVCAVLTREGYGHVTPTLSRDPGDPHTFGGFHTPHTHGTDRADVRRFVTLTAARRDLARLRNLASAAQRATSPAGYREQRRRGSWYYGPTATNVCDASDRVTVNWTSADGVRYWHDVSVIDYGAVGYLHRNGVREVGDLARYLAVHRGSPMHYPADVATCGACGRSWDDAVSSALTPAPSARCPFEYDHGEPITGWYTGDLAAPIAGVTR